jgi:hypothetical protein
MKGKTFLLWASFLLAFLFWVKKKKLMGIGGMNGQMWRRSEREQRKAKGGE